MRSHCLKRIFVICTLLAGVWPAIAAEPASYTRIEDVIYGRKFGTALTMDVFTPKEHANGAAVIFAVSGGFVSAHEMIHVQSFDRLLNRGYTVFAVVHGSQPEFTVPEILEDMYRAVRFIRHNAKRFHIDANSIGVFGASSGGHLSLMLGLAAPGPKPDAKDPVDQESSRVQAVACFFPPTDFLNWGQPGRDLIQALNEELAAFKPPFDFRESDPQTHQFRVILDHERRLQIARDISPINHVTSDDPPILVIHGDSDKLVPIQQARVLEEQMKKAGVTFKLIVKPGGGHGWPDIQNDMETFGDWFNTYLLGKHQPGGAQTSTPSSAAP